MLRRIAVFAILATCQVHSIQAQSVARPDREAIERLDALSARLSRALARCTEQAVRERDSARRERWNRVAAGASPQLADAVITLLAIMVDDEASSCAAVRELAASLPNIRTDVQAMAVVVGKADQVADLERRLADLQRRRDATNLELEVLHGIAAALAARNSEELLDVLRGGGGPPPPSLVDAIASRRADPRSRVRVGDQELWLTPFGYFVFEPIVRLAERTTSTRLTFQPLDFFTHDPVIQARLSGATMNAGLSLDATYGVGGSAVTVVSTGQAGRRPVDFRTPLSWTWELNTGWNAFDSAPKGEFKVVAAQGTHQVTLQPPLENVVHVSGTFSRWWEWVTRLDTAISLGTAIIPFIAGLFVGRRWRRRAPA
jgi:hypothetical protein